MGAGARRGVAVDGPGRERRGVAAEGPGRATRAGTFSRLHDARRVSCLADRPRSSLGLRSSLTPGPPKLQFVMWMEKHPRVALRLHTHEETEARAPPLRRCARPLLAPVACARSVARGAVASDRGRRGRVRGRRLDTRCSPRSLSKW